MIKTIVKRDGSTEPFIPAKVNNWGIWAAGQTEVDWSHIVMSAVASLPEECTSAELQDTLIQMCLDSRTWGYNLMAGRLYAPVIWKTMYPDGIPTIHALHDKLSANGLMRPMQYSALDYVMINAFLDHDRDLNTPYFSLKYIREKYAIQNRADKQEFESQQFTYMRLAMTIAESTPVDKRLTFVKQLYESFSGKKISIPTPNFMNMGTYLRGYASCCLYTVGDTKDSIGVGDWIAYQMTANSAGIGNNLNLRSIGDPVRNGALKHNGKLSYIASMGKSILANMQAGRGGAGTTYYNAFDPEVEVISQLRNPRSPVDKRNRDLHYAMMSNKLFARKALQNEDIFLFNVYTAPDLMKAFYSGDDTQFVELYQKYENDPGFKKTYISARKLLIRSWSESFETGVAYLAFMDEINRHTAFKEPIYSSNLCVAPETLLLTDCGYKPICQLEGDEVNVWNGEKFTATKVVKTGVNQPLLNVSLNDGRELNCTPYHKWYVQNEYGKPAVEKRTHELRVGDKLLKMDLPVIEGQYSMDYAYANGFYSGDGTYLGNGNHRIYLYGEKKSLKDRINVPGRWRTNDLRDEIETTVLYPKFTVPNALFTIKNRLEWLAGYLDADGCVYRNGDNEALTASSVNLEFLKDIQYMLQTLGVNSKITHGMDAGYRPMPKNDGTGESKDYLCKQVYRFLISSYETQKLLDLGLNLSRLSITKREVQREAGWFAKVKSIADNDRVDDTYCVTEPDRHMAVFNGILTGQCLEIVQPTSAYYEMQDLYRNGEIGHVTLLAESKNPELTKTLRLGWNEKVSTNRLGKTNDTFAGDLRPGDELVVGGEAMSVDEILNHKKEPEISMCSLAAMNVAEISETDDQEYFQCMYNALKMIDYCIYNSDYPFPHLEYTAKSRMNAGIGIMGLATLMARKGLRYDSFEGKTFIHRVSERHMYMTIKASLAISKERGVAPWIHKTKWVDGWTPLQTYNRNVDTLCDPTPQYDWEALSEEIRLNGGLAHSSLIAYMPGESSSKAVGQPNSIYPVRSTVLLKTDGGNAVEWVAPESDNPNYLYQSSWDIPCTDMVDVYAIIQKHTDQTISADLWKRIKGSEKVSDEFLLHLHAYMVKHGIKTRYYMNSATANFDGTSTETNINDGSDCAGGGCKI